MSFWSFFCRHRRLSFPITLGGKKGTATVVCFSCNRAFEYDWDKMRLGKERKTDGKDQAGRPGQRRRDGV